MRIQRRTALAWGVAAAAGAAGAGLAWWRLRPGQVRSEAESAFWASRFDSPTGAPLALQGWQGRPLLVNFWATWCPPCVEELPLLNAFYREQSGKGWQVLGLAVDQPAAVRRFLDRLPLAFPVGMAGLAGTELARSLGNPSGGLPYSVVFDRQGRVTHRNIGKLSAEDLAQWARLG
jgi:thiol-disulfide isomerase/thioredoxin